MNRPAFNLATYALAALLAGAMVAPAHAQPEKILDHPTGWTYLYGATTPQISAEISAGRRPLTIQWVSPNQYDVVTVANSGPYAVSGFGAANMHYDVLLDDLSAQLTGRRLISIDCRRLSFNRTRVTAISVPNTGSGSVGWGWLVDTSRQNIIDWVNNSSTPLRIVDLSIYERDGQKFYAAVVVYNTGSQFQNWWWYFDVTASQVVSLLQQNNARLLTIEVETRASSVAGTRFAVVMVAQNPGAGWFYGSRTQGQIASTIAQTGGRLTNLHRYTTTGGTTRYAVSLVDNANAQTRRVRDLMAQTATNGSYGFMLKRVGGSTMAALNQDFVFEPASSMKILHSAYTIRLCALGQAALGDSLYAPNRCTTEYQRSVCPDHEYSCNPGMATLSTIVERTMQMSHNGMTRTLEDHHGRAVLNYFASVNGMPNTAINHTLGCLCGNEPNTTTATDLVAFYERIANGTLFNTAWRDELFSLMVNRAGFGYGSDPAVHPYYYLGQIINEEWAQTNLTNDERLAFRAALHSAHKSGGYGCGSTFYRSRAGWYSIPFKVFANGQWQIVPREYTYAVFVHGGTDASTSHTGLFAQELVREQIREALQSWDAACSLGIAAHPQSVTVDEGDSVQFTCAAGGVGNAAYSWQRWNQDHNVWVTLVTIPGVITGVMTNTLTIHAATPDLASSYRCRITKDCGTEFTNAATLTVIPADATSAPSGLPTNLVLHAPAPNPFNPQVTLRFELPRAADHAVLEVFDVAGRRVRALDAWSLAAGSHEFTWDGADGAGRRQASGVYLARLRAAGEQATRRLVMVE